MKTNLARTLPKAWKSGIKNVVVAVALGVLGGVTLSVIDRTALDDGNRENISVSRAGSHYLP